MNILGRIIRKIKSLLRPKKAEIRYEQVDRTLNFLEIIGEGYGNRNSFINQKPVNSKMEPIPWFTYPSIEYLSQLNMKECSILEWGMGNSTLYFSSRCKKIFSIEHNPEWFNLISPKLPLNSTSRLVLEEEYSSYPNKLNQKYDIIIVDGIQRFECLKTAVNLLNKGGILIFDNADRNPEYCEMLRSKDLIQIDFHGFGPIVNFTTTTSIFFMRDFNFKPLSIQPVIPIGGGF